MLTWPDALVLIVLIPCVTLLIGIAISTRKERSGNKQG